MRGLIFLLLIFFAGCSSKQVYIPAAPQPQQQSIKRCTIGVMQLDLPWYMLEGKIYDKNEKKYIDIGLSEDIADWLMQRGVYYLQNSFPNATVGRYPWDFDKKPQLLVHIVIDELFVKNNTMIVEGKVFINEQAKILRFEESLNTNLYKSIDKIFAKLLAFVVTEVDRSCQEALDTHF